MNLKLALCGGMTELMIRKLPHFLIMVKSFQIIKNLINEYLSVLLRLSG